MLATQSAPIYPRVSPQAPMPPRPPRHCYGPSKTSPDWPENSFHEASKVISRASRASSPVETLTNDYGTKGHMAPFYRLHWTLSVFRTPSGSIHHQQQRGRRKKRRKRKTYKKSLMNINHPVVCFWPPFDPFPTRSTLVLPTWSPTSDHPGPFDGTHPSHFPRPSNVSAKPPPSSVIRLAPFRSPMPGHARPFLAL